MSVRRESDADAAEEAARAELEARTAVAARSLSGAQVLQLRATLEAAKEALADINLKGLPFGKRGAVSSAILALNARLLELR